MAGRLRNTRPLHAGRRASSRSRFDTFLRELSPEVEPATADAIFGVVAAQVDVSHLHPVRLRLAIAVAAREAGVQSDAITAAIVRGGPS